MTEARTNSFDWKRAGSRAAAAALAGACLLAPTPFAHQNSTETARLALAPTAALPSGFVFDPREAAPVAQPETVPRTRADADAAIEAAAPAARRGYPLTPPLVSAYARIPDPADPGAMVDPTERLGLDLTGLREGLEAYRKADIAAGDAAAAQAKDPLVSTALEWTLLLTHPIEAGWRRIAKFVSEHPDWQMNA